MQAGGAGLFPLVAASPAGAGFFLPGVTCDPDTGHHCGTLPQKWLRACRGLPGACLLAVLFTRLPIPMPKTENPASSAPPRMECPEPRTEDFGLNRTRDMIAQIGAGQRAARLEFTYRAYFGRKRRAPFAHGCVFCSLPAPCSPLRRQAVPYPLHEQASIPGGSSHPLPVADAIGAGWPERTNEIDD